MTRLRKLGGWATSRQGLHDVGAAIAAIWAIYKALNEAGVI